jgi:hypothetical protein
MKRPWRIQTALHEAAHAVSVVRFEEHAKLVEVSLDDPSTGRYGRTQVSRSTYADDRGENKAENLRRETRALLTSLLGPLMDPSMKDVPWPPSWEEAWFEDREDLREGMFASRITPKAYALLVKTAREIVADPAYQLDVKTVAVELHKRKRLTGDQVETLLQPTKGRLDAETLLRPRMPQLDRPPSLREG